MEEQNKIPEYENLILNPHLWAETFRRRKWRIAGLLVLTVSAALMMHRCCPGTWQSSALILMSGQKSDTAEGFGNVRDEVMAENLKELIVQDEVLERAAEKGLSGLQELRKTVRADHPEGTNLIRITACCGNPAEAERCAQAAAEASVEIIGAMKLRDLKLISSASAAARTELFSAWQAVLYGLSLWAVLGIADLMYLMYQYPLMAVTAEEFAGIRICRSRQDILFCCGKYEKVFVIQTEGSMEAAGLISVQTGETVFIIPEEAEDLFEQCREARKYSGSLLQIRENMPRAELEALLGNMNEYGVRIIGMAVKAV